MATAKKESHVGKTVKVHADLLDIKGKAHPFAGLYVDLISKTGKAYIAGGLVALSIVGRTMPPVSIIAWKEA